MVFLKLVENFFGLIFPRNCVSCYQPVFFDNQLSKYEFLCEACEEEVPFLDRSDLGCRFCGGVFEDVILKEGACTECDARDYFYDSKISVLSYRGVARSLILKLKYEKGGYLVGDLGEIISEVFDSEGVSEEIVLVPVPLHPRKERERGYNQSRLLADWLAKKSPKMRVSETICRTKDTVSQTKLPQDKRIKNMKNAFAIRPKTHLDPQPRYILVDDVYTTGATLNECARVLKAAGVNKVDALTLAQG